MNWGVSDGVACELMSRWLALEELQYITQSTKLDKSQVTFPTTNDLNPDFFHVLRLFDRVGQKFWPVALDTSDHEIPSQRPWIASSWLEQPLGCPI